MIAVCPKHTEVNVEAGAIDCSIRLENRLPWPTDFVGIAKVEDLDAAHGRVGVQATRAAAGTALCLALAMTAAATSGW